LRPRGALRGAGSKRKHDANPLLWIEAALAGCGTICTAERPAAEQYRHNGDGERCPCGYVEEDPQSPIERPCGKHVTISQHGEDKNVLYSGSPRPGWEFRHHDELSSQAERQETSRSATGRGSSAFNDEMQEKAATPIKSGC
jgi:hypothetical protein